MMIIDDSQDGVPYARRSSKAGTHETPEFDR